MKKVTDEEYKEFQYLRNQYSLKSVENLEDDIDFPIRNSVAILALADCTPMFSCCGFDYAGQPLHKAHQYGEPYIMLKNDEINRVAMGRIFSRMPFGWKVVSRNNLIFIELISINNPHWNTPEKVHFSENLVTAINHLEKFLFEIFSSEFLDKVILEDTNKSHNTNLKYWQYPPKNPWVITIDSLTI